MQQQSHSPLSVEQLLQPRYKVIADYPDNPFRVGTILCEYGGDGFRYGDYFIYKNRIDNYPHLFQKLQWWEERKPEELPKYVRVVTNADKFELPHNCVREVNEWRKLHFQLRADCFPVVINAMCLLPATEQEYINYKNSNNGK